MNPARTIGLDIGGANVKAVHSDGACRLEPFALWKQPERLPLVLRGMLDSLPCADGIAVTMTGELCDCFADKREGVNAILDAVLVGQTFLSAAADRNVCPTQNADIPIKVWSIRGFLNIAEARQRIMQVASANWHALATYVARTLTPDAGLLIDIGSTTTDLIPLSAGAVISKGYTDPERMQSGELVYTGVRRTPLCALLGFDVAAELFATTLDVNLLLGLIAEDVADCHTADGRPATRHAAHARLARMLCADADLFTLDEAKALAERALAQQVRHLARAVERVAAAMARAPDTVVVCGSGEFLARLALADARTLRVNNIVSLHERWGADRSAAACAHAVAMLAKGEP